jgi:hypothetical protein
VLILVCILLFFNKGQKECGCRLVTVKLISVQMILGEDVVERLQVTEDLILVADVAIPAPI